MREDQIKRYAEIAELKAKGDRHSQYGLLMQWAGISLDEASKVIDALPYWQDPKNWTP